MPSKEVALFGGEKPWSPVDWTDSDDRVRGGKSQSYISANPFEPTARFYGTLDIETLGGAGFASQRTATERRVWDLGKHEGIRLELEEDSDSKKYTLILKDSLLEVDPDSGREQATVSYEYDFSLSDSTETYTIFEGTGSSTNVTSGKTSAEPPYSSTTKIRTFHIPFTALEPTYRGKPYKSAPDLRTYNIRRFSIMNRSFFGSQSGPFSLRIRSISAYGEVKSASMMENWRESKLLPPVFLLLGTAVLMRTVVWGIDTFLT